MRGKFIHDISANSIQVILNQFCGLAVFYVLSVDFTKNDFGEINWSLAVLLTVFSILSFGIDQVIVKKIAAKEDPRLMLSVYFSHVLLSGGLFYCLLLTGYFIFPTLLHQHSLLLFLGIGKLMIFFSSPFKQLANGLEKFKALLYMNICSNVLRGTALICLSFFFRVNLTVLIIIFISGDAAEFLLSLIITRRSLQIRLSLRWDKIRYLNVLKESLPQAGVVIFTSAIARFDWIFLGILATNVALAEYSFAFRVFEVATWPLLVIAPVLIPRFTRLFHPSSATLNEWENNELLVLFKFEIIIACLFSLLLNILWVPVIDWITHGKYGAVNRYTILILSGSMPLIYVNNFLWTIHFAQGRLKTIFYIFFITFLVNILADIILIPFYGAHGAAIAYILGTGSQFLLFWIKTDIPDLKKYKYLLLLSPFFAIAGASLSARGFEPVTFILFISVGIFFLLLFFTRVIRRSDWSVFRRITGV